MKRILIAAAANPASAEVTGTKIGLLESEVDGATGLLISSSKKLQCVFTGSDDITETCSGSINNLGLDVSISGKSHIKWVVCTPGGIKIGP